MEKEFIPYEQALALKELGFDEFCLAFYWITGKFYITAEYHNYVGFHKQNQLGDYNYDSISAPTFSQVFRWFREKYDLVIQYIPFELENPDKYLELHHKFKISEYDGWRGGRRNSIETNIVETYEEAELECLKKLIEIVKK